MTSRFRFISTHRGAYGVKRLARLLVVSRSGFYRWLGAEAGRAGRAAADAQLLARIRAIHTASGGTYGIPRITAELAATGCPVNHKRVERLMRAHHITGRHLRRRLRTTIPGPAVVPAVDLIRRDFHAEAINQRWCGDITYLRAGGRWLYLATVIDIASRRLIGWSINTHMRTSLVTDALAAAVTARAGQVTGVIMHTDNGTQYTSHDYAKTCRQYGIRLSRGQVGSSYDNALAESLFATLKRELPAAATSWPSEADARRDLFQWIAFYNHRRRHSALGYQSPTNYETRTPSTSMPTAA